MTQFFPAFAILKHRVLGGSATGNRSPPVDSDRLPSGRSGPKVFEPTTRQAPSRNPPRVGCSRTVKKKTRSVFCQSLYKTATPLPSTALEPDFFNRPPCNHNLTP